MKKSKIAFHKLIIRYAFRSQILGFETQQTQPLWYSINWKP